MSITPSAGHHQGSPDAPPDAVVTESFERPARRVSRRSALALGGGAVALAGAAALVPSAVGRAAGAPSDRTFAHEVHQFTRRIHADMDYRPPTLAERATATTALLSLAARPEDPAARVPLQALGFDVYTAANRRTRYVVAASDGSTDRSWGLYAFPIGQPLRVLAEVPHPRFDLDTENVGLDLVADLPTAAFIEAGAHRHADDGKADVAHQTDSLFHAVVTELSRTRRLPQVQLHGFDDDHPADDDVDVILSAGASRVGSDIDRVAASLARAGLTLCRAWSQHCPNLEGRTNVQGRAADENRTPFLHIEMSDGMRGDKRSRSRVAGAIADGFR